jgi:hypothetical protein
MRVALPLLLAVLGGCASPPAAGPPPCEPLAADSGFEVRVHLATNHASNSTRAPASVAGACVRASQARGIACCFDVARAQSDAAGNATLRVGPGEALFRASLWAGASDDLGCAYEASGGKRNVTGPAEVALGFGDDSLTCSTP